MSHLQASTNEKVRFQRRLKDNTNLEIPPPNKGGGGGLKKDFKWENNEYQLSNRLKCYESQ